MLASSPLIMSRLKYISVFCILALILFLSFTFFTQSKYDLVVFDQDTKEEYLRIPVELGDKLQLRWRHSVELTTWMETIEVIESQFKIIESKFENFGAGVSPTTKGKIRFEDGFVVMYDLAEIHQSYRWIHSQKQQFTLAKDGKDILLHDGIPHHRKVEMIIEER